MQCLTFLLLILALLVWAIVSARPKGYYIYVWLPLMASLITVGIFLPVGFLRMLWLTYQHPESYSVRGIPFDIFVMLLPWAAVAGLVYLKPAGPAWQSKFVIIALLVAACMPFVIAYVAGSGLMGFIVECHSSAP
jgi:hypothetical protein